MTKVLGGALLMAGLKEDFDDLMIGRKKTLNRISLIRMYESGEVTLQYLNAHW